MRRWLLWLTLPLAGAVLVAAGILFHEIRAQAGRDEAQAADVILVLGAAEYNGRPSPVLKARLDHALELYRRGLAHVVITTGGHGPDRRFTEAGVSRTYLTQNGIAAESIFAVERGERTTESLSGAVELMRQRGWHACLVVSDGFHIYRLKKILAHDEIEAYGSPTPSSRIESASAPLRLRHTLREMVSYLAWLAGRAR